MPNTKSKSNNKSQKKGKAVKMQQPNSSTRVMSMNQGASAPSSTFKERRVYFSVSSGSKPGSVRIRGQDYMGVASWTSALATGATILNLLVSPGGSAFFNTRLGRFAQLYDKYLFRNLTFHAQTGAATSNTGSYILAYDTDVSDPTPPASADAVRQFLAHQGSRMAAVWESISINCPLSDNQNFYYTNSSSNGDERLCYQGQIYLAVATAVASTQNMSIWVEYDIELFDPQLESPVNETTFGATSGITNSTANAAWNVASITTLANPVVPKVVVNGNTGVSVPPGSWLVEQALQQSTAGGNILQQPSVLNEDLSVGTGLTALNAAYNTVAAIAGGNAWRADKLVNPGPDNKYLFGNFSTNGETVQNLIIKVLEMGGSSFV